MTQFHFISISVFLTHSQTNVKKSKINYGASPITLEKEVFEKIVLPTFFNFLLWGAVPRARGRIEKTMDTIEKLVQKMV